MNTPSFINLASVLLKLPFYHEVRFVLIFLFSTRPHFLSIELNWYTYSENSTLCLHRCSLRALSIIARPWFFLQFSIISVTIAINILTKKKHPEIACISPYIHIPSFIKLAVVFLTYPKINNFRLVFTYFCKKLE